MNWLIVLLIFYLVISLLVAIGRISYYSNWKNNAYDDPYDLIHYDEPVLFDVITFGFLPSCLIILCWILITKLVNFCR